MIALLAGVCALIVYVAMVTGAGYLGQQAKYMYSRRSMDQFIHSFFVVVCTMLFVAVAVAMNQVLSRRFPSKEETGPLLPE